MPKESNEYIELETEGKKEKLETKPKKSTSKKGSSKKKKSTKRKKWKQLVVSIHRVHTDHRPFVDICILLPLDWPRASALREKVGKIRLAPPPQKKIRPKPWLNIPIHISVFRSSVSPILARPVRLSVSFPWMLFRHRGGQNFTRPVRLPKRFTCHPPQARPQDF